MQNQEFAKNLKVILDRHKVSKFKGAPRPKYESRWPSFCIGLLIYIYFKDGIKKMFQNGLNPPRVWRRFKDPGFLGLMSIFVIILDKLSYSFTRAEETRLIMTQRNDFESIHTRLYPLYTPFNKIEGRREELIFF